MELDPTHLPLGVSIEKLSKVSRSPESRRMPHPGYTILVYDHAWKKTPNWELVKPVPLCSHFGI